MSLMSLFTPKFIIKQENEVKQKVFDWRSCGMGSEDNFISQTAADVTQLAGAFFTGYMAASQFNSLFFSIRR